MHYSSSTTGAAIQEGHTTTAGLHDPLIMRSASASFYTVDSGLLLPPPQLLLPPCAWK